MLQARVLVLFARACGSEAWIIEDATKQGKHFDAHLTTLRLRLRTRLDDKRWHWFLNLEEAETRNVGRVGQG